MMVTRFDESRLLLVLQIDHSRVAGFLAAHWGNQDFAEPTPYESMVLAAQEHDSGWQHWEAAPTLNDQGHPPDYIGTSKQLGQGVWLNFFREASQRVVQRDPYAGLQVSMHAEGLVSQGMGLLPYMFDYSGDSEVQEFIQEQKAFREKVLSEIHGIEAYGDAVSEERLWTNFKYMEVFDQMAQFVCNRYPFNNVMRKNGPTNRLSDIPVPVGPGREDITLTVDVQDEKSAIVRPYPFDVDPLIVSFTGRLVSSRPYESEKAFLKDFYKGERVTVTYTLHSS